MKIKHKDFEIEFNIAEIEKNVKLFIKNVYDEISSNIVRNYTIALIDERYNKNGYIIEYGTIRMSKNDIDFICITPEIVLKHPFGHILLEDIIDKKYLIESSGELNGYENNTPELNNFDFVFEL